MLSRLRWSGFPVDFAIGFGPGLRAIVVFLKSIRANLSQIIYSYSCVWTVTGVLFPFKICGYVVGLKRCVGKFSRYRWLVS